jgi:hypothetical protein
MKIILEKTDRTYLYIAAVVLIFSMSVMYQVKLSNDYDESIKVKEAINNKQRKDIGTLELSVVTLDKEALKLMLEADSLQASEEKYKLSYYAIDKKLKISLALYSTSDDDVKWRLLTKAINE